jgi:hypothetical protein
MAKKPVDFIPGSLVYRNTWKNQHGHIRTSVYSTEEIARAGAYSQRTQGHLFQEIATPVQASACLISPEYWNG